jgi:hypothetical protein
MATSGCPSNYDVCLIILISKLIIEDIQLLLIIYYNFKIVKKIYKDEGNCNREQVQVHARYSNSLYYKTKVA